MPVNRRCRQSFFAAQQSIPLTTRPLIHSAAEVFLRFAARLDDPGRRRRSR